MSLKINSLRRKKPGDESVLFSFVPTSTLDEPKSLELSDSKFNNHPRHKYVDHKVEKNSSNLFFTTS